MVVCLLLLLLSYFKDFPSSPSFPIFALLLFSLLKVELESPTLKIFHLSLETLLLSILPKPQLGNSCLSSYNPQFNFFLPSILSQRSAISSIQPKCYLKQKTCSPEQQSSIRAYVSLLSKDWATIGHCRRKGQIQACFPPGFSYMSRWAAILNGLLLCLIRNLTIWKYSPK